MIELAQVLEIDEERRLVILNHVGDLGSVVHQQALCQICMLIVFGCLAFVDKVIESSLDFIATLVNYDVTMSIHQEYLMSLQYWSRNYFSGLMVDHDFFAFQL